MRAIFITYRRDDTEGQAGRLFDDLVKQFGEDSVFMDVVGIEPGRDFRRGDRRPCRLMWCITSDGRKRLARRKGCVRPTPT